MEDIIYANVFSFGIAIFLLIIGIISCFYGNKFFKALLTFYGFCVGIYFFYQLFGSVEVLAEYTENDTIRILLAAVGGLLVAVLVLFFYYIGVFLLGGSVAILAFFYLNLTLTNAEHLAVLAVLIILGGLVALIIHKAIIIIATSIFGAWEITNSLGYCIFCIKYPGVLIHRYFDFLQENKNFFYLTLLLTIFFAAAGMMYQFRRGKKNDDQ